MTSRDALMGVRDFFFKPQGIENIGLMRIFFGMLLIYNWMMTWHHLPNWYGVDAIISMKTSLSYGYAYRFSFFDFLPQDQRVVYVIAILNLIGSLGVLLGLCTRKSMILAFLTLLSFHNRNEFILNSGDSVFQNILFFMIFTPAGDVYSLDRLIKREMGLVSGPPAERSPWALRLIQIQFCMIYIATVMFKLKGSQWVDGTAVYVATRLDETARVTLSLLNEMWMIKFATWSTLVVELALGTLVWFKDLRYWVLLAGVFLHLGIEVLMIINLFEWVMLAGMLCLVDSQDVKKVFSWMALKFRSRPKLSRIWGQVAVSR